MGDKEIQLWKIDIHRQIVNLTRQLVEIGNLKDHDESDHKFIASFKNSFQGCEQMRYLLIEMNMLLKLIFLIILVFLLLESTMHYVYFEDNHV